MPQRIYTGPTDNVDVLLPSGESLHFERNGEPVEVPAELVESFDVTGDFKAPGTDRAPAVTRASLAAAVKELGGTVAPKATKAQLAAQLQELQAAATPPVDDDVDPEAPAPQDDGGSTDNDQEPGVSGEEE